MSVRIRFFARFRELADPEIVTEVREGTSITALIYAVTENNQAARDAIFDQEGGFRRYVILMQNGARIETTRAGETMVADGDEIAIFPPVAGG
ncbi:MAG: MoaD/ThiS family protein [Methanomicrobiales archaeon]|nr:MoaD/ThiS family protein [Methanomicrobiales archaeon]